MSQILALHEQAMDLAEMAFVAKLRGDLDRSGELSRQAFQKETKAAELAANNLADEPSRSVLHRSAATLAIDCGEFREAERLIATALAGNPPQELAEELRDLWSQVNLHRYLAQRGISLESEEYQQSISGKTISLKGQLRFADSIGSQKLIKLVDEQGQSPPIIVPEEMMSDIVKPLWGDLVVVQGIIDRRGIQLSDIKKAVG